ncbi:hypothetical protein BROC_02324 [Candidatus Brocadiaceae bacterium]|nr:hypothetical protein BROC_02324 [Candidatus Brocadiaceae bacterium]
MTSIRPPFNKAWNLFKEVNTTVQAVGEKIGGKIKANTDSGIFKNACPIRMSYVLNYSGVPIPTRERYAVASGGDGKWYMFRVNDMMDFLKNKFGPPDITAKSPSMSSFYGKKGILLTQGHGWTNARGHVTLWNGTSCSDTCHLTGDPENGSFVPESASLWILK